MSEENAISEEEKIKIAANFLFHSPPGEFKEVFLGLCPVNAVFSFFLKLNQIF